MKDDIFNIKNDKSFEKFALQIFEYQIKNNKTYSKYANLILKGNKPINIYQIPFLPIQLFKTQQIICSGKKIDKIFLSSGTQGARSKHLVSDINLYQKSYRKTFEYFYGNIEDYVILTLLPNYREKGDSSLIYMVDDLIKKSKHKMSGFFKNDYEKLSKTIKKLEKINKKIILFGTSNSLLNFAKNFARKINNLIILETGGTKGNSNNIIKEELHKQLKKSFSINQIHSEYGMTELLSQSYSYKNGLFKSPPWKKILIRDIYDPKTIIDYNKTGGINVIDLANIYSCPFIATEDIGKLNKNEEFSILGRIHNSDLRGCNLLI